MDVAIGKLEVAHACSADHEWTALQQVVFDTAKTTLCKPVRKHQVWLDPEEQEQRKLLVKRDQAHQKVLLSRSTRSTPLAYKDACRQLQHHTRLLKTAWWDKQAEELQRAADRKDMKVFYSELKAVWGPQTKGPVQLKSADGQEPFSSNGRVLARQDGVNTSSSFSMTRVRSAPKHLTIYRNAQLTTTLTKLPQW